VDRCALFVDAGYVLADGAMAVHGTRRRESVSWEYEGLLQLFASLASERSGLPLLRCYWYEATVEGRRNADHDALADLPGVKLRLAKMRPGRREGVESEIHRDLTTLARNNAISDAIVVSAEEDLAPVVADAQDLGLRVTLLHIATDGDWTVSRALRQECDDIVEISSDLLRPYVELISGAEPPHADDRESAPLIALRPTANGHAQPGRTAAYAPAPIGPDAGHQLPPPSYDAPVIGEPAAIQELPARPDLYPVGHDAASALEEPQPVLADMAPVVADYVPAPPDAMVAQPEAIPIRQDAMPDRAGFQELYGAPVAFPAPPEDRPVELPAARSRQADLSGYNPGAPREPLPREPLSRDTLPGEVGDGLHAVPVVPGNAQIRRLPTRGTAVGAGVPAPAQPSGQPVMGPVMGQPSPGQPTFSPSTAAQPAIGQPIAPGTGYPAARNGSYSGPQPVVPPGQAGPVGPVSLAGAPLGGPGVQFGGPGAPSVPSPVAPEGPGGPVNASGPMYAPGPGLHGGGPAMPPGPVGPVGPVGAVGPIGTGAYPSAQGSSLAEAVQSAHDEGQEFGASVARDAPALWLEAVLARKPRMPSDLEARLLQGSALPIDFLLHDEVRHALRRGFWDALERARR